MAVDSVTMGGSVSALLGLVAPAVPDGSRVATLTGEFTSTTFPFAAQAARGVTVTELTADELIAAAADYDVVTASLVQSANGDVLDVDALRAAVAGTDTLTVLDAPRRSGGRCWTSAGPTSPPPRSTSGCWRRGVRPGCR